MGHVPWLDEDEQRTWRAFLAANRLVSAKLEQSLQTESGMPQAYYELLVRLSEAPDRTLRMSELATTSQSSRSRVSHAVARMEEAGWIARTSCPTDRRGQLAALTDRGMAVLEDAAPGHVRMVRSTVFDALTREQQHALREASEALVAHLSDGPLWLVDGESAPDPGCDGGGGGCASA